MQNRKMNIDIIGYDCGWGCADIGCEDGPEALDMAQILHALTAAGMTPSWHGALGLKTLGDHEKLNTKEKTLALTNDCLARLAQQVGDTVKKNHIPLVIGGDHSSAIGTWSALTAAQQCEGRFGLIWMDAHMDAHTFETSYQGKWGGWWHGQPVAALTGNGLPAFTQLSSALTKISPQNLTIIGAHSFEPAEEEYVNKHGIRVFTGAEVARIGFKAAFDVAMERALDGTAGFGMSIDLDGFHGAEAPGVGTAEQTGMRTAEVLPILRAIAHHPQFRALEIAEFNPHNDVDYRTRHLVTKLIETIFQPMEKTPPLKDRDLRIVN